MGYLYVPVNKTTGNIMNIIIFGPPLAGKGTQSKRIIEDYKLTHLSTGDALRAEQEEGTVLGMEAAEYSQKGLLAPDHLVDKIVERFYHNHKSGNGFLFDGYPRNTEQAKYLLNVLETDGNAIDRLILLKVPHEELLKRAQKRAMQENRKDDKDSDIVLTRINEFMRFTLPAVEHMKSTGIQLIEIDGTGPIDETYLTISNALSQR